MPSEFFAAPKLRRSQQVALAQFNVILQEADRTGNYQPVLDFMAVPANKKEIYNLSGALNEYAKEDLQPPASWPIVMQDPITQTGDRKSGQSGPFLDPRTITVVPLVVSKQGPVSFRVADFPSTAYKFFTVSASPGDLTTPIVSSSNGNNVGVDMQLGPGTYYVNIVFWIYATNQPSSDAQPQGVVMTAQLP